MGDFQFNVAKGRIAELALLAQTNDAMFAVVLNASGLEADSILKDYANLSVLLAASNDEHSTLARQTMTSVTATPDYTHDVQDVDAADLVYPGASGAATGKIIICYDYDTTSGTDTSVLPLVGLDFVATLNGGNVTYQFPAADAGGGAGFIRFS